MAKSTKKTAAKKTAAKTTKPAADNKAVKRDEASYVKFFDDLKQGNKTCNVTVTTDQGTITFKGVKAYPYVTELVNENSRNWIAGEN